MEPAFTGYIKSELPGTDAALNTTRTCNDGYMNWGTVKPACCALL
jgi:hypothetical protein